MVLLKSDPARLFAALRSAWWALALLVPLWGLFYACNAAAWQLLTAGGGGRLPFARALAITVSVFALNYVTPFLSFGGEPIKVLAATPWIGSRRAVASVVAFRLLHALSHVLTNLLALLPALWLLPPTPTVALSAAVLAVALLAAALFLLSRHREGVCVHTLTLLERVPLLSRLVRRLRPEVEVLHELDAHVTAVRGSAPKRFGLALAIELTGRVLAASEFTLILWALGHGFHPLTGFVAGSFSSLVVNLLIFLPFELGSKEGGLYLIFQLLGFDPVIGVQTALLSRVRELVWVVFGLVVLALSGESTAHAGGAARRVG